MTAAKGKAQGNVNGFRVRRIYEPAAADDGFRVLVDRLWPRGVSRELEQEPAKAAAAGLREKSQHEPVTLLYAARDQSHNNAVALKEWLERHK